MKNTKNNSKVGWIISFFAFIYMSTAGQYESSEDVYISQNSQILALIELIIATFIMMIVPAIYRVTNHALLPSKKGKKICMWNSIILFFVPFIFGFPIIGGIGALLYYYINIWLFVDYNNIEDTLKEDDASINNEEKVKCDNGDARMNNDNEFSTKFGEEFEEENSDNDTTDKIKDAVIIEDNTNTYQSK